ncbi:MAG: FAD-dependent oxidoreductase [Marinilabiliales bacterium]|nr:FAD-dependent oxidoreductase [Marinilabiliales bacterium]
MQTRISHQLFLEPEGWDTNEYYINGFASSLALETQINALQQGTGTGECSNLQAGICNRI